MQDKVEGPGIRIGHDLREAETVLYLEETTKHSVGKNEK
jgi:hypothetical protein